MTIARMALVSGAFLAVVGCSQAGPTPSRTPVPTASPSATPAPSPTPSASPVGRTFMQADFTKSGGCGDVYIWATTADETFAVTIDWRQSATKAWENGSFEGTVTLPVDDVAVTLMTGASLSQGFCTDIGGQGRVDGNAPAVAGTVEIAVTPDAGGFQPASHADLTMRDVVFDITFGGETEQWRIDQLELEDLSVGWFAG